VCEEKSKYSQNVQKDQPSNKYVDHDSLLITVASDIAIKSQTRVSRTDDCLSPVGDLQLAEDIRDMVLHCFYAEQ
jgi:hypothetical protein